VRTALSSRGSILLSDLPHGARQIVIPAAVLDAGAAGLERCSLVRGCMLDHVFVFARCDGPQAERLISLGFVEGSRNMHPGQGTANRRFFFKNAMLELIWVRDEREARSSPIAATGLWERSRFRETGASPFGICLRSADQTAGLTRAFEDGWRYCPPYLPAGLAIPVARTASLAEPMLFAMPHRPSAPSSQPSEPVDHANGLREITAVRVTLAAGTVVSAPLREIERLGIATFVHGREALMELSFDGALAGKLADLRPDLPLVLRW
jgi:hypothetical protein